MNFLTRKTVSGLLVLIMFSSLGFHYYYTELSGNGVVDKSDPLYQYKYKSWEHYCRHYQLECNDINRDQVVILGDGFIYDNNAYYLLGDRIPYNNITERESAYQSYLEKYITELFPNGRKKFEAKDIDQVLDWEGRFSIVKGEFMVVDSAYSYVGDDPIILTSYLFRNTSMVFLNNSTEGARMTTNVDFVDPRTLEVVDETFGYIKDKNRVYHNLNIIYEAEPKTFKVYEDYSNYASDHKMIFFENVYIKDVDHATFKPIARFYGKDKVNVYTYNRKIEGADPNSFSVISDYVGRDKNHVYAGISLIEDVDLESLKKINDIYAWSKNAVFFADLKIENVDPATFRVLGDEHPTFSRDDFHLYKESKQIEIEDLDSFEFIDDKYAKDSVNYYCLPLMHGKDEEGIERYPYKQKITGKPSQLERDFTCFTPEKKRR